MSLVASGVIQNPHPVIITAETNNIYVFYIASGGLYLRYSKSTDNGATFKMEAPVASSTIFGTSVVISEIDVANDDSGLFHVVCYPTTGSTRDVTYNTLDTDKDIWGTWEQAAVLTSVPSSSRMCSITVDANQKPHISYFDTISSYRKFMYTNKVGASWTTPYSITDSSSRNDSYGKIMATASGIHAFYNTGSYTPIVRIRDGVASGGTWGAEDQFSIDALGGYSHKPMVINGAGEVSHFSYNNAGSAPLYEEEVEIASGLYITHNGFGSNYNGYYDRDVITVLYVDDNLDLKYIYKYTDNNIWNDPETLKTGSYYMVAPEYLPRYTWSAGKINYVYADGASNLYYGYMGFPTSSKHAYMKGQAEAFTYKRWWHPGGILIPTVKAAFQPQIATSYEESKIDVGYSTTLTEGSGISSIKWERNTGWLIEKGEYFTTDLITENDYTALVKYSNVTNTVGALLGETTVAQTRFNIYPYSGGNSYFRSGGTYTHNSVYGSGIIAVNNKNAFYNGLRIGDLTLPTTGTTTNTITVGGERIGGVPLADFQGNIQLFTIWDGTLSESQINTITNLMRGISGPTLHAYTRGVEPLMASVGMFTANDNALTGDLLTVNLDFSPKIVFLWYNGGTSKSTVTSGNLMAGFTMFNSSGEVRAIYVFDRDAQATSDVYNADSSTYVVTNLTTTTPTLSGMLQFYNMYEDGFKLQYAAPFSKNLIVSYLALGGTDIENTKITTLTTSISLGEQDLTGVGFKPDVVLTSRGSSGARGAFSVGMATSSGEQIVIAQGVDDNVSTTLTNRYAYDREMMAIVGTDVVSRRISFVNFINDGIRVNALETTNNSAYYALIKGGKYKLDYFLTDTTNSVHTVSGLGFTPKAVLFYSHGGAKNTQDSATGGAIISIGAVDSNSNKVVQAWNDTDAVADTQIATFAYTTDVYTKLVNDAIEGALTATISGQGFTWYMTNTESTPSLVTYLAIGESDSKISSKSAYMAGKVIVPPIRAQATNNDGTKNEYDTPLDPDGDINVTEAAAMASSPYGLAITIDDTALCYIWKVFSDYGGLIRFRFYFDPNSMTMGTNSEFPICNVYRTGGIPAASVWFHYNGTSYRLQPVISTDDGNDGGAYYTITDEPHLIEIELKRETSNTSNNGYMKFWIDGVLKETLSGKDNFASDPRVTSVAFGIFANGYLVQPTSGTFYIDEFAINTASIEIGSRYQYIRPAYTKGAATTTSSKSAYLKGSSSSTTSKSAYLEGTPSEVEVSYSHSAYLAGIYKPRVTNAGLMIEYVSSEKLRVTNAGLMVEYYLAARGNKSAYIKGGFGTDSKTPAYVEGIVAASDNQSAYTKGQTTTNSSVHAFMRGQDTASTSRSNFYKENFEGAEGAIEEGYGNWITTPDFPATRKDGTGLGYNNGLVHDNSFSIYDDTVTADQYAKAKVAVLDEEIDLVLRYQTGTGYFYSFWHTTDGAAQIYYYNGTWNYLNATGDGVITEGCTVRFSIVGWTLRVEVDGTEVLSYTDENHRYSNGLVGLGVYGTVARIDDWEGGSLVNLHAFTQGIGGSSTSKHAYLEGKSSNVTSKSAYTRGSTQHLSNKAVYLTGQSTSVSNKSAYMMGYPCPVVDTFNRADGGLGSNWHEGVTGVVQVESNQAHVKATSMGSNFNIWKPHKAGINQTVAFTVIDSGTYTYEYDLLLKAQSISGTSIPMLEVWYGTTTNKLQLWYTNNGNDWYQIIGEETGLTFTQGDVFWATAEADGTVKAYKNATLLHTWSATAFTYYANDGYVGVWMTDATGPTAAFDNFGATKTETDVQNAYLKGKSDVVYNKPAFVKGQSTNVANKPAYIRGKLDTSDNQIAFTKGQSLTSDNQLAFVEGYSSNASSKVAYTRGQSASVANKSAYLRGSISVTDSQSAYTKGQTSLVDSQIAYTQGAEAYQFEIEWATLAISNFTILDSFSAFTRGGIAASDNALAYTKGATGITGNKSAYLRGSASASDNQLAYLRGRTLVTYNKSAYLRGASSTADNQIAYTRGQTSVVYNKFAYLRGITGIADNQIAYTKGQTSALADKDAYLRGSTDVTAQKSAYLRGGVVVSSDKDAYTKGSSTSVANKPAYVEGQVGTKVGSIHAYIKGKADSSDNQFAYTRGSTVVFDNQVAYLKGQSTYVGNKSAYTHGKADYTSSKIAYTRGSTTASDNQIAYVHGKADTTTFVHAYLRGQTSASESKPAYLIGKSTYVANKAVYVHGKASVTSLEYAYTRGSINYTSNKPAYIASRVNTTDSKHAYTEGYAPGVSTQKAYLRGLESNSFSHSAFTEGAYGFQIEWVVVGLPQTQAVEVTSQKSAYTHGLVSTSDSHSAFISGKITVVFDKDAYLVGKSSEVSNKSAFIAGKSTFESNKPAYIKGSAESSESIHAFVVGSSSALDNQAAFTKGKTDALDNQSAFVKGSEVSFDNQTAYTKGKTDVTTNQHAYLAGGIIQTDSQSAYINGTAPTASSIHAFLLGYSANTSNIPAYTHGKVLTSSSKVAYLRGGILQTTSRYAYIHGKSTSDSSKPAYLVGKTSVVYSRYAYLKGSSTQAGNVPAYVRGGILTSDSKNAFIASRVNTTDVRHAFTNGYSANVFVKSAYTRGKDTFAGNKPAFVSGVIRTSRHAYINGRVAVASNQPAYIVGKISATYQKNAYISGKNVINSQKNAFISGKSSTQTLTKAYLCGKIEVVTNRAAYTRGIAPTTTSNQAFTSGKALTNSSRHAYLNGGIITTSQKAAFVAAQSVVNTYRNAYLVGFLSNVVSKQAYTFGVELVRGTRHAYVSGTVPTTIHIIECETVLNTRISCEADINTSIVSKTTLNTHLGFNAVIGTKKGYKVIINSFINRIVKI